MSRTIAIGDVHGCDVALATLLDLVEPGSEDTIVLLGDVVDRGPNVRGCRDCGSPSIRTFVESIGDR